MKGYISTLQFAKAFGISRQRVLKRIAEGSVKAQKFGHVWFIPESEAKHFRKVQVGDDGKVWLIRGNLPKFDKTE